MKWLSNIVHSVGLKLKLLLAKSLSVELKY